MSVIILRNTTIPNSMQEELFTAADYQTSIQIGVFEGERKKTTSKQFTGKVSTIWHPPAPRGKVQILVTFTIDADGILSVSAENKTTGIKKSIKIIKRETLTEEEIKRMVKDAEQIKSEDKEFTRKNITMLAFKNYAYNTRDIIESNCNLENSVRR